MTNLLMSQEKYYKFESQKDNQNDRRFDNLKNGNMSLIEPNSIWCEFGNLEVGKYAPVYKICPLL